MRVPRMTTRRWMIAVAIVVAVVASTATARRLVPPPSTQRVLPGSTLRVLPGGGIHEERRMFRLLPPNRWSLGRGGRARGYSWGEKGSTRTDKRTVGLGFIEVVDEQVDRWPGDPPDLSVRPAHRMRYRHADNLTP